jgi:WD40 repeat protein
MDSACSQPTGQEGTALGHHAGKILSSLNTTALSNPRFSNDGSLVVTASNDKTAQVWDTLTGQRVGPPPRTAVKFMTLSSPRRRPCGHSSADYTARVWDARRTALIPRSHMAATLAVQFSPRQ